jgi:hypothetical protein
LLLVDFKRGRLLQLSARGTVHWNSPEVAAALGADRILTLEVTGGQWLLDAVDLRWT